MADIFLSYSSQDRERIRPLVTALEHLGWSVWWDREVPPGGTWRQMIEVALEEATCVLVVWSEESVKSKWVQEEADEGASSKELVPVLIDNVRPPLGFRTMQAARLIDWHGDLAHPEFQSLADSIRKATGKLPVRKATPFKNHVETLPGDVPLEMIAIPGGSFEMGSKTLKESQPIHTVTLSSFYIGKYPVTQAQWKAVMRGNPSGFKGDILPVDSVSWADAKEFCEKLSEETGREYRLPSEAEWEYVARAGSTGDYCFGDDSSLLGEYGCTSETSKGKTLPVGLLKPNGWGLHDVHGNVREWCEDIYHKTYEGAPNDGSAWVAFGNKDSSRILRGGSWAVNYVQAQVAYRYDAPPTIRVISIGFRLALNMRRSSF